MEKASCMCHKECILLDPIQSSGCPECFRSIQNAADFACIAVRWHSVPWNYKQPLKEISKTFKAVEIGLKSYVD